jgi:threonine dehydrogenase-like Zn-dependent dehydrogenase
MAAYLDADWLPSGEGGDVPALILGADDAGADEAAGWALTQLAQHAAAAVGSADSATVLGTGTVARQIRRLLAERGLEPPDESAPAVIVEATGKPGSLAGALAQVAPLGTVVVVGEYPQGVEAVDLYADLHGRGLTLVGLGRPAGPPRPDARNVPEAVRAELVSVPAGASLPDGAGWYRLDA